MPASGTTAAHEPIAAIAAATGTVKPDLNTSFLQIGDPAKFKLALHYALGGRRSRHLGQRIANALPSPGPKSLWPILVVLESLTAR